MARTYEEWNRDPQVKFTKKTNEVLRAADIINHYAAAYLKAVEGGAHHCEQPETVAEQVALAKDALLEMTLDQIEVMMVICSYAERGEAS